MTKRKKCGGLYRQRGSPHYFADYIDGSGKRRRRSTGCENKKDAQRVRATWVVEAGKGPSVEHADRVTFEQLEEWLQADYKRQNNKSWGRVETALKHLRPVFGRKRAVEITADATHRYDDLRMAQNASPATRQYELAMLRRMFKVAIERRKLQNVPGFPKVPVDNARHDQISEREHLLLTTSEKGLPDYARPLQGWLYHGGLRDFSECVSLTWAENVDLSGQRILLWETKQKEPRVIPYRQYPELRAVVEAQLAYTQHWERVTGKKITAVFHRAGVAMKAFPYRAWHGACERLGIVGRDGRHKIPHDNKRSFRRRLDLQNIPRSTAKKMIGHKTDRVFDRYFDLAEHDLEDAFGRLSKHGVDGARHRIGIETPDTEEDLCRYS